MRISNIKAVNIRFLLFKKKKKKRRVTTFELFYIGRWGIRYKTKSDDTYDKKSKWQLKINVILR